MAQYPFMPLATDAYLADTTHLSTLEHGAYMLLLMTMWRAGGELPNDDKLLARYARLTAGQWKRIKPVLMPFFTASSDSITQGRLTDELVAVRQKSKSAQDNAKSRWLKTNETGDANASEKQCDGNANLNLILNLKEEPKGSPKKDPPLPVQEAFDYFIEAVQGTAIPKPQELTEPRRKSLKARLAGSGLEKWQAACRKLAASDWCAGRTSKGWVADIDFLLQPSKFVKVLEGGFDNRSPQSTGPPSGQFQSHAAVMRDEAAAREAQADGNTH